MASIASWNSCMEHPRDPWPCSWPLSSADFNLHPKQLCASCKEREPVHTSLPGHGAHMGRPLPRHGTHLGRTQHTGTVHRALVAEHPSPLPRQSWPWAPQSRIWTNSRSWTGWWPWALLCVASLHRSSRGFHCTHDPGPLSPPTTPLPDSGVPLLRKRSPWNFLPLMAQKKWLDIKPELQPHVHPTTLLFLAPGQDNKPDFLQLWAPDGWGLADLVSQPDFSSNAWIEVFINTCLQAVGLPLWFS